MRLAFSDKLIVTNHFDPEMAMLADRHSCRRLHRSSAVPLQRAEDLIRNAAGDMLIGWLIPDQDKPMDGQTGTTEQSSGTSRRAVK